MREINVEPHWPSMWKFIQQRMTILKGQDQKAYDDFIQGIGGEEQLRAIEYAAKNTKE
jgi:hypothetical protein|tara:strand:- start:664 stop:837 length:174 start_codon:yes stop_codon:yes gene_type:complete